jgi:predicted PurR-regulated permease PerM
VRRAYVLGGVLAVAAVVAAAVLVDVLATVFLAVTVAYLLAPVRGWLVDRGLTQWTASVLATLLAFAGAAALVAPLIAVTALRLDRLVTLIQSLPDELPLRAFGIVYVVTLEQVQGPLVSFVSAVARATLAALPVLALKFALFVLLVFSLVHRAADARRGVIAVVPPAYRGVAEAFNRRVRGTLFGIYVLQAATAFGTFVLALPTFIALGYRSALTLSVLAGVLQFVPIVGPSILLGALALAAVSAGDPVRAALVLVVGGFVVAWLPDLIVRPRLARRAAHMPGSLYFVGFVGGLLSLGTVGIIAGPLVVALVVEAAEQLSSELNDIDVEDD